MFDVFVDLVTSAGFMLASLSFFHFGFETIDKIPGKIAKVVCDDEFDEEDIESINRHIELYGYRGPYSLSDMPRIERDLELESIRSERVKEGEVVEEPGEGHCPVS